MSDTRPTAELVRGEGPLGVFDAVFWPDWAREEAERQAAGHPPAEQCEIEECLVCGLRDCPMKDPLHYHHDGCPAEWLAEQQKETK